MLFLFFSAAASSTDWTRQGFQLAGDQIQVTREKMEQLRRIMEERKARRRARREARASPYSTSWSLKSSSTSSAAAEVENELSNLQVFIFTVIVQCTCPQNIYICNWPTIVGSI